MPEITHRTIQTNGINMHIAEAGSGRSSSSATVGRSPGTPGATSSPRLLKPVTTPSPGTSAVRQTDKPQEISQYTQLHMVGDIVGLLDALGEPTATIVGHDWGAPVAWNSALLRPDRFPAVVGMSVPYGPRGDFQPSAGLKAAFGDNFFYILYFQEPGKAEANSKRREDTLRKLMFSARAISSGRKNRSPRSRRHHEVPGWHAEPESLPAWLTQADLDYLVGEFKGSGFRGGLNWYRNMDRNWEMMGAWRNAKVTVPALFITGEKDVVRSFAPEAGIRANVPNLKDLVIIPGAGHWVQQERPAEVNAALIGFLKGL